MEQYLPMGRMSVLQNVNWHFVENGFHCQINLGNTGVNKVDRFPVNSEEREFTLLPKHVLHKQFIHLFL